MIHIGLFEGIGGFGLASDWMGWKTYATCEINPFGGLTLPHHWPDAYHHGDIHTLTIEKINHELTQRFGFGWRSDDIILTGGFPCQPYSNAGKRRGKDDDRHLWPEYFRLIREIKPRFVVAENVPGLVNWNGGMVFDEVQSDLESEGYQVTPFVLPAASVNAPHLRDRIWIIAYAPDRGCGRRVGEECPGGEREILPGEREGGEMGSEAQGRDRERNVADSDNKGPRDGQLDGEYLSGSDRERGNTPNNESATQECADGSRTTPNAGYPELQRSKFNGSPGIAWEAEGKGGQFSRSICPTWDQFPTQPPLFTGNDGFSTESLRQRIREDCMGLLSEKEIDSIISKASSEWRKETIKASGNAIVGQVCLQIFKAIEKFRKEFMTL